MRHVEPSPRPKRVGGAGPVVAHSQILTSIYALPADVREQPPLRLALAVADAVVQRNYARFFTLLRRDASYLQACLMHQVGQRRPWVYVCVGVYVHVRQDMWGVGSVGLSAIYLCVCDPRGHADKRGWDGRLVVQHHARCGGARARCGQPPRHTVATERPGAPAGV
jgi:hypothetical protein